MTKHKVNRLMLIQTQGPALRNRFAYDTTKGEVDFLKTLATSLFIAAAFLSAAVVVAQLNHAFQKQNIESVGQK